MIIDIRDLTSGDKFHFIGKKNHHKIINTNMTYRNLVTGSVHFVPRNRLMVVCSKPLALEVSK